MISFVALTFFCCQSRSVPVCFCLPIAGFAVPLPLLCDGFHLQTGGTELRRLEVTAAACGGVALRLRLHAFRCAARCSRSWSLMRAARAFVCAANSRFVAKFRCCTQQFLKSQRRAQQGSTITHKACTQRVNRYTQQRTKSATANNKPSEKKRTDLQQNRRAVMQ